MTTNTQTTPIKELRKRTIDQLRQYNESLATSGERPAELAKVQKVLSEKTEQQNQEVQPGMTEAEVYKAEDGKKQAERAKASTGKRQSKGKSNAKGSSQGAQKSNKRPPAKAKGTSTGKGKAKAQPAKGTGGKPIHADDAVIRVLVDANPKRPGSRAAQEWELYKDKMTVKQYLEAGGSRAGIRWDEDRGFIRVEDRKKS